jgi:hypothetical protein
MIRPKHYLLMLAILTMGAKCTDVDVTDPKVAATMTELNTFWRQGYSQMLQEIGTKHYLLDRSPAFNGLKNTLEQLGFKVVMSEGDYYMSVEIPAWEMFTEQEWDRVRDADESNMRKIASKHLGLKGKFASLEPDGLMIDGKVTLIEKDSGVDISLTFRLRAIEEMPAESILPRREYPPPYAARVGYEKIWKRFEQLTMPMANLRNN